MKKQPSNMLRTAVKNKYVNSGSSPPRIIDRKIHSTVSADGICAGGLHAVSLHGAANLHLPSFPLRPNLRPQLLPSAQMQPRPKFDPACLVLGAPTLSATSHGLYPASVPQQSLVSPAYCFRRCCQTSAPTPSFRRDGHDPIPRDVRRSNVLLGRHDLRDPSGIRVRTPRDYRPGPLRPIPATAAFRYRARLTSRYGGTCPDPPRSPALPPHP